MDNEKLLKLLNEYLIGKDSKNPNERAAANLAFENLLISFERMIELIANDFTRNRNISSEDLKSHLRESFWKESLKFDGNRTSNLEQYIRFRLNRAAYDYTERSKEATYYKRVTHNKDKFDKDGNLIEQEPIDALTCVDYEVTEKIKAVEIGKIIDYLKKNCDSVTRQIITEHMRLSNPTDTAISERLGISRTTVKRRLLKLHKIFETPQFLSEYGNINDYLSA